MLKYYLYYYINYHQNNWVQFLLIIKFIYNNSVYNTINKILIKITKYYISIIRRYDVKDLLIKRDKN